MEKRIEDMTQEERTQYLSAMVDFKLAMERVKLGKITTHITTYVIWFVLGCGGLFAIFGIVTALDLILKALGVK